MSGLLLSGGLDSTALAFWLRPARCLTIDYGQRAAKGEIRAATQICEYLGIAHETLAVPLRSLGAGDMASSEKHAQAAGKTSDWWPCRNQQLITLAVAWALKHKIDQILIGSVADDRSHGDASPAFIDLMNRLLEVQGIEVRILAPALELSKADLIRQADVPVELLGLAHSCHTGEFACGYCRACNAHMAVMGELGMKPY